jgi:alpha-mannosidase
VLTAGSRRIAFVTTVDWHENHKMLRTSFPVAVTANEATCDIQFGSIKRQTNRNTSWDFAKYEICAHKWVDLSQWDYGVALLNDCKYGHKVLENVLDLNLLRSPKYPDPQADQAQHEFTYALYPHPGNHIVGKVARAGYELNVPLRPVVGAWQGSEASFAQIEAENVIIETIKKAEENDDIILRLYESSGAATRTLLTFNAEIAAIWQTNLLEEVEKSLEHQQKAVALTLSPFEILTLRVRFVPR